MPDEILDYVKVVGRIGLTVGDSAADAGVNPDMVSPDEGGTVSFTPLTQLVKVTGAAPPVTIVNSVVKCILDSEGYLTYNGQRFVWLLDLGSAKVNPVTPRNAAAYRVDFDVRIRGVAVTFPSFTCHPLPGVDNDLTLLAPVTTGATIPNVLGPPGPTGAAGAAGAAGATGPTGAVGAAGAASTGVLSSSMPPIPADVAVNTLVETTLLSLVIDPARIAVGDILDFDFNADILNNTGGNQNLTVRYYLGGALVFSVAGLPVQPGVNRSSLQSRSAISLASLVSHRWQTRQVITDQSSPGLLATEFGNRAGANVSTVDLSTTRTLVVTVQWASAVANTGVRLSAATLRRSRSLPGPTPVDRTAYSGTSKYLKIGGGGLVTGISQARANGVTSRAVRTDSAAFHHWDSVKLEWIQDEKVSVFGADKPGSGAVARSVAPSSPLRHWVLALGSLWKTDDEGTSFTDIGLPIQMYANDNWRQSNPRIAIDPANPNHVLVGTQYDGMFRSENGVTFAQVSLPVNPLSKLRTWVSPATSYAELDRKNGTTRSNAGIIVRFDPTSGVGADGLTLRAYAIVMGVAVLRTEDSGRTWTNLNAPWPLTGKGFAVSTHNGDVAIVTQPLGWSITRSAATTGGTFTITLTDGAGAATTTPIDHRATGSVIKAAVEALGKGQFNMSTYVNTTTWAASPGTIDFAISFISNQPLPTGSATMTLNSSNVTGGVLSMIEDTIAIGQSLKVMRYRPAVGWTDITPTGTDRPFGAIVYSPHTPGHMLTGSLGGMGLPSRFRVSTDYGATWGSPVALTATASDSDVLWQGNLAATQNLGLSFISAVWDLDDIYTVIVTEGTGVWRHRLSDLTNNPATLALSSMTNGIEQMVANDLVTLPPRGVAVDSRVLCGSWDRPIFIQTDRTKNPINYKPDITFGSGWCISTLPGDADFAVATVMNHQDGTGSARSATTVDGGDTWTPFPTLPDTSNYSWGQGQVCASTRQNWVLSPPGTKLPQYTLNGGQTWNTIVLPSGAADAGKIDTTLAFQYANRRAVAALGPLWFVVMVKNVGVFQTTDGGATWALTCSWASVNMGTSNDGFPARLVAVNSQTSGIGGASNAHLWWITGATGVAGVQDKASRTVRSVDGGATWTVVEGIGTVHAIAFGPTFDGTPGYTTVVTGYDVLGNSVIASSVDQGATWSSVGNTLGDMYVNAKTGTGDPLVPGRFYFGTSSGYYQVDVTRYTAP